MKLDLKNMGLVLEGGGMRGVFTCGVLDYFMIIISSFHIVLVCRQERVTDFRISHISAGVPNTATSI